jgi:hypothetical protein
VIPTVTRSWFGTRSQPPETGLPAGRVAELVLEQLREVPMGGYPVALQPLVVPRESYRELLAASAGLLDLLRRAVLHAGPDRQSRMAALGIDPHDCEMFVPDEVFELRHCADMARADVVIGADGPKFVEFNVSGAFGGMVHYQMFQQVWHRIRELAGRPAYLGVDAFARLALLVERSCAELGVPASAVLVGTPREWGPDTTTRQFDVQAAMLRGHGVYAVHLDFEELLAGIGLPGPLRWPLGIGEFTVQDARELGYDTAPARAALDAGFRMIPSQTAWLLHSKRTLAMLSEGLPWMDRADRALADRYLPWSRLVGDRAVYWQGGRYDLPQLLVDHRERFVLKGATGCSGAEVTFGGRCTDQEWRRLVEGALGSDYYVAQEVVESAPYPLEVMVAPGEVVRITANSVISPFCIGGAVAGCFARFLDDPQPGVVSALRSAMLGCLLAEA